MENTVEEWRDIAGYEGLYQVSNLGRVKSLNYGRTGKEKCLKPKYNGFGYLQARLCKNGETNYQYIHRLVLEAFVPNPETKPEVDHINRDRTDNRLENLRWVTSRENKDNGVSKSILCIETGKIYPSTMEAERQTGVNRANVISCCRGRYKTAGGYHWKYCD